MYGDSTDLWISILPTESAHHNTHLWFLWGTGLKAEFSNFLYSFCIHIIFFFPQKSQYRNAGLEAGVNFSIFIVDNTPIGLMHIINVNKQTNKTP